MCIHLRRRTLVIILVYTLINAIMAHHVFADEEKNITGKGRGEKHFREEKESENKKEEEEDENDEEEEKEETIRERDEAEEQEGDELTGDVAAVLFGLGNANVLLSIVLRALSQAPLTGLTLKDTVLALNRHQQRHLRRFHYILNPLAAGTASLHWYFSKCGTLTFQQWGTALAILLAISGLIIKYRLVPQSLRQRLFQLHTSPLILLTAVALVFFGHIFTDD